MNDIDNDIVVLKPCPFCGGIDIKVTKVFGDGLFKVECWSCGAGFRQIRTKNRAVELWNTRKADK